MDEIPVALRRRWRAWCFYAEWAFMLGIIPTTIWVGMSDIDHKINPYWLFGVLSVLLVGSKSVGQVLDWKEKKAREDEEAARAEGLEDQARRMVEGVLEYLWRRYFDAQEEDRLNHRVTLFRCVDYDGPDGKGKRLEIFARSGRYKESKTTWEVDENKPERCRGIAGEIWLLRVSKVYEAACDWSEDPQDQMRYAQSLRMTVEQAKGLNVKLKVFTGAPIPVGSRTWGVLLLDSCVPGLIVGKGAKRTLLLRYADILSHALEGLER